MAEVDESKGPASAFESPTFGQDVSFNLDEPVGSASISPCGRDVVLASRQGLHIIDLDSPYSPPRHLAHHTPWEVADVQWSPFAARDYWVVSTSNQKALVWNLGMANTASSVEHVLHAHSRAITDINFSAHNPDILSTCAVDSFVHCWDLRHPSRPAVTFCDWFAGATQVKWNRQDPHILASSHDKFLRIWDDRKGAYPLRSIEAHTTKIYGVDWSRTESTNLATCSLDRTIKFWDYTRETNEPEHLIRTSFPVWRARHTPFGFGLLAMPQRGDHDLHLYDRRLDEDPEHIASAIHRFDGHNDQVKEFLWRPRGSVTDNNDNREFQLVSWGTDRMLRLHKISDHMLADVGYEQGMKLERRANFTRRNAVYKTFREAPSIKTQDSAGIFADQTAPCKTDGVEMRSALTIGMSRASVPFIGGYGNGGFISSRDTRKSAMSKDMDPISWMRGVKIGKRDTSPLGMHQSISSILSTSLKGDPTWDVFDSLGEEITHVGEKFAKVAFDEVDMTRRRIVVSLSGPWGPEKTSTYTKSCIEFPSTYPDAAAPKVCLEKTAALSEETVNKVNSEVSTITASFLSRQRSSLEAILRYVLGEQTLEESLSSLRKRQESVDFDSTLELDISSSDEDDEDQENAGPQANNLASSDPMIAKPQAQNNPPLPRACGAAWAHNGRLVCFFPPKPEKEPSFLDLTLKASSSKSRNSIFEGFGRFHNGSRRNKQAPSTLETIQSGDSDASELSFPSSASSSSSDDIGLPRHHYMPGMAWRGDASEAFLGASLGESQKSSSGMGKSTSPMSAGRNFVSIHDHSDLLPVKRGLAQDYIIGQGSYGCAHNARVAREAGDLDLADVWVLVDLILQDKVPLKAMNDTGEFGSPPGLGNVEPIFIVARRAASGLKSKDSAIDLSYDRDEADSASNLRAPVKWGAHPFGRWYLVDTLIRYNEYTADVQMLAMLSCAFDENWATSCPLASGVGHFVFPRAESAPEYPWTGPRNYFPSERIAKSHLHCKFSNHSSHKDNHNIHSRTHSAHSSTGAPLSDLSASGTPPANGRTLRTSFERSESQAASLSGSPEHIRHTHRSMSNLSTLTAPLSRPFSFSSSVASSPPNAFAKKRSSPAGSYLGTSTSGSTWNPSHLFGRSSTITEDLTSSLKVSSLDMGENTPRGASRTGFITVLKNQDQFHNDGHAQVPFLDARQQKYRHYREAYAHLLYTWGLPIARAEILNYNYGTAANSGAVASQSPSFLSIGNADQPNAESNAEDQCLVLKDHCTFCAVILPYKSTLRRCQACSVSRVPTICLLCNTFIQGLSSPCLKCGHVLHAACRYLLFTQAVEDIPAECISGCGCICADHTSIIMETPQIELDRSSGIVQEECSPAVTIVGDAVANEQEQIGWYDNSEWEDMAAYESLARNLQPRNEFKPKVSQVWRRRKENNTTG